MNTLRIISLTLALLTLRPVLHAQEAWKSNVHFGLIYPLSTNGVYAKEYTNRFSLHGIAGVSRAETGVAIAGVVLVIKGNASGFQVAGFLNLGGSFRGYSLAGFGNISHDSAEVQTAGFINKADNVRSQIGGFINLAKNVRGVQIAGFINIADSSEYPIGLLNLIRNGERSIGISTDETLTTMVTFRSGSKKLYGIIGVGDNAKNGNNLYAWEAGLGAHTQLTPDFRINTELTSTGLSDFRHGWSYRQTLRILPALRLRHQVEIFAGPSFNHDNIKKGEGDGLTTHYLWSQKDPHDHTQGLYFGVTGGVSFIL